MHNFTFVIKHISDTANKADDALSRKCLLLQEFRVKTLGFDDLKEMYQADLDFKEAYEAAENPILRDISQWVEYMIQEGLLFKGNQALYSKMLHEGEFAKGETQWRIGRDTLVTKRCSQS
jgi:hypothetical protein